MAAWLARLAGLDCKASSATGGAIFNIIPIIPRYVKETR